MEENSDASRFVEIARDAKAYAELERERDALRAVLEYAAHELPNVLLSLTPDGRGERTDDAKAAAVMRILELLPEALTRLWALRETVGKALRAKPAGRDFDPEDCAHADATGMVGQLPIVTRAQGGQP